MRKLIYSVGVSLDGYIADPNGGFEWLNRATHKAEAAGEDFGMTELFSRLDCVLIGRKTYEVARAYGAKGTIYPGMTNYIFSRTLPTGERDGMHFVSDDPVDVVARLKQQPGKDIWLCGGGELAREFLKRGALDEIRLGIVPCMIGGGIPSFPPGFDETELELIAVNQYKGGIVELRYRVVQGSATPAAKRKSAKTRSSAKRSSTSRSSASKKASTRRHTPARKKPAGRKHRG